MYKCESTTACAMVATLQRGHDQLVRATIEPVRASSARCSKRCRNPIALLRCSRSASSGDGTWSPIKIISVSVGNSFAVSDNVCSDYT